MAVFGEAGGHNLAATVTPIATGVPVGEDPGSNEIVMPSVPSIGGPKNKNAKYPQFLVGAPDPPCC